MPHHTQRETVEEERETRSIALIPNGILKRAL